MPRLKAVERSSTLTQDSCGTSVMEALSGQQQWVVVFVVVYFSCLWILYNYREWILSTDGQDSSYLRKDKSALAFPESEPCASGQMSSVAV